VLLTLELSSSKLWSSCHKLKSVGASFPEDTFPLHVNWRVFRQVCIWAMPPLIEITFLLSIFSGIYNSWESVEYSNGSLLSSIYGSYMMKYNQSSLFCLRACVLFLLMEMACIFWFCIPCCATVDVSSWYNGNITLGLY
jgi:hypothetical protein